MVVLHLNVMSRLFGAHTVECVMLIERRITVVCVRRRCGWRRVGHETVQRLDHTAVAARQAIGSATQLMVLMVLLRLNGVERRRIVRLVLMMVVLMMMMLMVLLLLLLVLVVLLLLLLIAGHYDVLRLMLFRVHVAVAVVMVLRFEIRGRLHCDQIGRRAVVGFSRNAVGWLMHQQMFAAMQLLVVIVVMAVHLVLLLLLWLLVMMLLLLDGHQIRGGCRCGRMAGLSGCGTGRNRDDRRQRIGTTHQQQRRRRRGGRRCRGHG